MLSPQVLAAIAAKQPVGVNPSLYAGSGDSGGTSGGFIAPYTPVLPAGTPATAFNPAWNGFAPGQALTPDMVAYLTQQRDAAFGQASGAGGMKMMAQNTPLFGNFRVAPGNVNGDGFSFMDWDRSTEGGPLDGWYEGQQRHIYDNQGNFLRSETVDGGPEGFIESGGLALAALAAMGGGAALTGAGVIGGGAAGAGGAGAGGAGVSGAAFGDAGLMYGAADAAAAGTLGGGAMLPGASAVTSGVAGVGGLAGAGSGGSTLSNIGSLIKSGVTGLTGGGGTGWASLIAPAMSAVGGWMQSEAAGDATDAQMGAAREGIGENRRQFDKVMELLSPYIQAGGRGLDTYEALAGSKGPAAQAAAIAQLQQGSEYGSLVSEGENAILQNASATGGLRGGNTQASLAQFRPKLLASLIDRQLGRFDRLTQFGQNSAAGAGTAALTTGGRNAELMQQAGAAQAGGIVAGSNAITNAMGNVGGFFAGYGVPGGGVTPPNPYAGRAF